MEIRNVTPTPPEKDSGKVLPIKTGNEIGGTTTNNEDKDSPTKKLSFSLGRNLNFVLENYEIKHPTLAIVFFLIVAIIRKPSVIGTIIVFILHLMGFGIEDIQELVNFLYTLEVFK